ncbi:MAG: Ig-like domain-containing protein, partial [Myxococcaceae bacterium]|nr:Ig-like domain-containing protein [Myxococcaceae bacterium]
AITPANGATGVALGTSITVTFSEALDASSVSASTLTLRDAGGNPVAASVSYSATTRTATLTPASALAPSTAFTATVRGGSGGVRDVAGTPLAADVSWSFTTAALSAPPPAEGPGGPLLVVAHATNPFSRYYAEILRAEGFNLFAVRDLSTVTATVLAAYDVVVLGEGPLGGGPLTEAQVVAMLSNWVSGGGRLIAMRPGPQLAGLLGLSSAGGTLADAYLRVDTTSAPGAGIVGETLQFHGPANRYTLNGATAIATLYSSASAATAFSAVTLRSVGSNGGQAAAFTYDLARSVVYTRQGNPAWAGQERDGVSPIRPNDLFFGSASFDPQPDWVDLTKVAIPQADEQQRLLANLILHMNRGKKPLPRFWYLPRGERAVVVMTGDDHANGGTSGRWQQYQAASPAGCDVATWECVRATSYIYPNTPLSNAAAQAFQSQGFEVALHVNTGCQDFTPQSYAANVSSQLGEFASRFPSVAAPVTNRNHCIAFSDWATVPKTQLANGIRLDTNYYYWPPQWLQDRPGFFTGSGMPMRFADLDGTLIDVYQATTQMTDESEQSFPFTINTLLDRAIGAEGYYGAFVANMHTDSADSFGSDAIVASAQERGVPVVSSRQLLEWLDGRNGSAFGAVSWNGSALSFDVTVGTGASGLQGMVPASSISGPLSSIRLNGSSVSYVPETIKGVDYAVFSAFAGSYVVTYAQDTTAPTLSARVVSVAGATAVVTWTSNEAADSQVQYGTSEGALTSTAGSATLVTSHSVTLTGLAPNTTYFLRVSSADASGNRTFSPAAPAPPATFTTPAATSTPGLVAAYAFGEGAGSTAADASGNGHTATLGGAIATLGGATWTTAGRYGSALSFDGLNAWVTINDATALDLTTGMTLEAWVRPNAVPQDWTTVLLKENVGGLAYALYGSDGNSRPPVVYANVGGDQATVATTTLPTNAWTHLAATYDGATMRLYVNGKQVTSRTLSGPMATSDRPLRIGGNSVWGEFFNGLIDEVRIYNRALSQAEILTDMNTPLTGGGTG